MNTFIKLLFKPFVMITVLGIIGVLTFSFTVNTYEIFIIMYQIIIIYYLYCVNRYVKSSDIKFSRVDNGAGILEGTILFPMGIVALIGKIISSFYQDHPDLSIWNQDIKYVFIVIIVSLILNLLLDKLNNKDSTPKAGTKTQSLVPAMWSGAGSEESSSEDDDADGKKKTKWERFRDYCSTHKKEIAVIVLVVVAAIIYGRYPKSPQPPKGPTGDNPTPPGPPPPPQNEDPKPQDEDPKAHGGNPPPPPQQEDKKDEKTEEHAGGNPPSTDDQTQKTEESSGLNSPRQTQESAPTHGTQESENVQDPFEPSLKYQSAQNHFMDFLPRLKKTMVELGLNVEKTSNLVDTNLNVVWADCQATAEDKSSMRVLLEEISLKAAWLTDKSEVLSDKIKDIQNNASKGLNTLESMECSSNNFRQMVICILLSPEILRKERNALS
jgi:hypothetical protein